MMDLKTHRKTRTRWRRSVIPVIALVVLAAACSSSGEPTTQAEVTDSTDSEPTTTTAASTAGQSDVDTTDLELIELEVGEGNTRSYVSSAMGGVRFEVLDGYIPLVWGDQIVLTTDDLMSFGPGFGHASVGLQTVLGATARLETTSQYLGAIEGAGVEVTPTDTKLSLFGYELAGYEMVGGDPNLFLFGAERFGAPSQSMFGPLGNALEYLGDTPNGVFRVSVNGPDASVFDLLPALGHLVSSLEFTGPGLDAALPDGQLLEPADPGPPPDPIEPSGELPPLGQPFAPIEPARYELVNFGAPVSVDVPSGWWAQPNFPGIVVLTAAGSVGPGDRDIVFINDINGLMPISGGPVAAGDLRPIDDLEALLDDTSDGLDFSDIQRFDLGDDDPFRVVSSVITADQSATCTALDPCDYGVITSYGFVKQLVSTLDQRIWFFPDHPSGLAAAIAQGPTGGDWMDEAVALMATMEFGPAS